MRTAQTPRERLIDDEAYEGREVRERGSTENISLLVLLPRTRPDTHCGPARPRQHHDSEIWAGLFGRIESLAQSRP